MYTIGTTYMSLGKNPHLCTIVDIHTTTNAAGEVFKVRYVANHDFLGQQIADYDVNDVTVARGIARLAA